MFALQAHAQDDMYFVPKKKSKATIVKTRTSQTSHSGSDRDVDEYNRRYDVSVDTDSVGNEVVTFDGATAAYLDTSNNDYAYTRQMSRFDDYEWNQAYREGYSDGRYDSWWMSGNLYYDPWYYDPWHYNRFGFSWGYHGWHIGWDYGWSYPGWWHRPPYWHYPSFGGVSYRPYKGVTGTRNKGTFRNNRDGKFSASKGSFSNGKTTDNRNRGTFNNNRSNRNNNFNNSNYNNGSFNSNRNSSFGSSNSSFGSNRSGGGSFGGSRSSGGGGSRSGGSFGGRR